jgi:hypothetical protein
MENGPPRKKNNQDATARSISIASDCGGLWLFAVATGC